MNARSRMLVAGAIFAIGAATFWLAATQADDDVRYVEEILARPAEHVAGQYTLMGIPEPARIPLAGSNGTFLAPNPRYGDATRDTVAWMRDGVMHYSTRTLQAMPQADGSLLWRFRNETRLLPSDPEPALPPVEAEWTFGQAHEAFPVVGFSADGVPRPDTPRVWAWYGKAPENPMQPKPSQFTGRLMATLPDGTPLPEGAFLYEVSQFTAGCSSKFLPPEARETYEAQYGSS